MSELINTQDNRAAIRRQLLATVSAFALLGAAYGAGNALAADSDGDHPQLWIEVGGQYDALAGDGQQPYAPPFVSLIPTTLPSPLPAQKLPGNGFDWNGKLSFEPDGSDWVFSASIRYGRSSGSGHVQKSSALFTYVLRTYFGKSQVYAARGADYVKSRSLESETHTILDFMAGKDVGLGMFGGKSVLSGGVRVAQFNFGQTVSISAGTDYQFRAVENFFDGAAQAKHSFQGIGPAISWDASAPVVGNAQNGEITFDWGVNAAVLFGKRKVKIHHQTSDCFHSFFNYPDVCISSYSNHGTIARSRQATIPNLGGFVGMSMRYNNAKISFGYRADEFFGAKDGGFASAKNYNLGFYGPFANVSIGIGG